ncbi:transcription factor grauzone-like isoform X2 [Sabethes cyaneus]|uniref:transcription factor grauzone-like isoform X2 n=1 Tax=Sabethes cyaneus TaxID=53552 RepID=UPI00237EAA04|nr:transcription factor grauzone-like isoform X2 [Sabethes cyaneus]
MECVSTCRLCTEKIASEPNSIKDDNFKMKIDSVFCFPIELKQGYSTSVCQMCSEIICQFYEFSENVRLNQEKLAAVEHKPSFEEVKVESVENFASTGNLDLPVDESKLKLDSVSDEQDSGEDIFVDFIDATDEPDKQSNKNKSEERSHQTVEHKKKKNNKSNEEQKREDELLQDFYKFVCEICEDSVPDFPSLRRHFRKNHNLNGYIRCCKRKFFRRCYLLEHIEKHVNPEAIRCEICNKNYADRECLQIHKTQAHGKIEDRPFKCDLCSSSFSRRNMLNNHLSTHEKAQCPQCDKILANKASLSLHLSTVHGGQRSARICDTCGKNFLSKNAYEQHLKKHQGIDTTEQKLQCSICYKWLVGKRGYQHHMQYIHNESGQSFVCDECNQTYPNSRALRLHKNSVHVDSVFSCELCGKNFKRSRSLKEHMASHTGETLYKCRFCGQGMNNNGNLYTHIKKCHRDER